MIFEKIPLSYEIQAFAYRNVLRIIKERKCRYDEAWDIFKKEFTEKLTAQLNTMKEGDKGRQPHSNQQKMDRNRNRNLGVRENHRSQRTVCSTDDSAKEPTGASEEQHSS